ncbi:MAG: ABC transporter ATP-binding protein [Tissierellales bacterium]|nr:ABC transporter ATP-binding protein [Tissierellales bacterium]MBN2826921.1 ABC transporter ATP-binding protein [Tissierellales bacterium]
MDNTKKLLEIKDLTIHYVTVDGTVRAVENLDLSINAGETLGLVGETGAGKTTSVKAVMKILPVPPAKVISGQILFKGEDILKKSKKEMRKIRGAKISMIFQDPMTSLNPVMTVSEQIEEAIGLHNPKKSRREIKKLSDEMLETVGIKAERSMDYPHQFSGGMKQRVVIAMALACNPELIIADEPTTALDVTIQAQVLDLMKKLKDKFNTSMIMITHDLGVVAEICDYVAIMYSGEVVEHGTREHIFHNALHPYTKGLFACIPNLYEDEKRLKPIKGLTPDPVNLPKGCKFHPRCPYAMEICSKESPKTAMMDEGHMVKCHLYKEGMADGK